MCVCQDLSQHQQVKATVQRLVRQVRQRDDKIVQLQQLLVRDGGLHLHGGLLTSLEDRDDVAITSLIDGSTTHPDTTTNVGMMMGTGVAASSSSTMEELVHQQIEETRISMQQTADKVGEEDGAAPSRASTQAGRQAGGVVAGLAG